MERGYAGATAEAIATEAGVAAQTIYAIFKNKKKMLVSLMNVSPTTGVEDHTPMPERPNVQAVSQERDQRRQLEMFAQVVAANLDQVAVVSEIMADAAKTEPDFDQNPAEAQQTTAGTHDPGCSTDCSQWTIPRENGRSLCQGYHLDIDQSRGFPPCDTRSWLVKREICRMAGRYAYESIVALSSGPSAVPYRCKSNISSQ